MTTPNIDLYLPKTYVFERVGKSYPETAPMTRRDGAKANFVYLPAGMSVVTVTATGVQRGALLKVVLQSTNYEVDLTGEINMANLPATARLWFGQISNKEEGRNGFWLRIIARNVGDTAMRNGSVSVQITNFPPET